MNRAEILGTAKGHVTKDRNATHGEPEDSFGMIAKLWSARLGINLRSDQVCIMLCDLKTARAWTNPAHADNWIDLAGYAACGGECAEKNLQQNSPPKAVKLDDFDDLG